MNAFLRRTPSLTAALCVLVVLALGPGCALHALADVHHHVNKAGHDHGTEQVLVLPGYDHPALNTLLDDSETSCTLEHQHGDGHATGIGLAVPTAPLTIANVAFDAPDAILRPEQQTRPRGGQDDEIDKPPRPLTSA